MKENILVGAGLWFASTRLTRDITVAYVGVPLNVLVACAIGAFCSLSFSDKIESRKKMWAMFFTSMFMGAALTALVNAALLHWVKLEMTDGLQAGIGAVVSFITIPFLSWLTDFVKNGKWLNLIPWRKKE